MRILKPPVSAFLLAVLVNGCGDRNVSEKESGVSIKTIEEVLQANNDSLMALPGVVGTAIGLCDSIPCIRVFLRDSTAAARGEIPPEFEGYRVKVEVTGAFRPRPDLD